MLNTFWETKFSGANADKEIFFFPVQLTTFRIGNLTRLIHTLDICVTTQKKSYSERRKVDEKSCVTFLLCDPGWYVQRT